jgi:hypothetical protein
MKKACVALFIAGLLASVTYFATRTTLNKVPSGTPADTGSAHVPTQDSAIAKDPMPTAAVAAPDTAVPLTMASGESARFTRLKDLLNEDLTVSANLAEAKALAEQLAPAMRQILQDDPQTAYELAVPADAWATLPGDLQPLLPRQLAESGIVSAFHDCSADHSTVGADHIHDSKRFFHIRLKTVNTGQVSLVEGLLEWDDTFHAHVTAVSFEKVIGIIAIAPGT